MTQPVDIALVGGGIVGLATALALTEAYPRARVAVLDKEPRLASHQTGHNSGVIHSGIYYKPGSLKARLCVEGARLMKEFCDAHGIGWEGCGKVIVATDERELPRLQSIHDRAMANGLTYDFSYVLARDIADLERNQSPEDAYNELKDENPTLGTLVRSQTGVVSSNLIKLLAFDVNAPSISRSTSPTEISAGVRASV